MRTSICITVFNEEKSIEKLIWSLLSQTKKVDEIVIVDGGSTDKTTSIIKKYPKVKLIISKNTSIAKGRNIAISNAENEIVVLTDGGCVPHKDWLEKITQPFNNEKISVVAGFYKMTGSSDFQRSLKPFIGVVPNKFDEKTFLPSGRSMAFRKKVWSKVGKFDEKFDKAGEDTDFNLKILSNNFEIVRVKSALVDWEVPNKLGEACKKFFYYARGDAQSGNFKSRHNKKVLTVFLRYFVFLVFQPIFLIYLVYGYWKGKVWGTIIQISSDISVMAGFIAGFIWVTQNK